VLSAFADAKVRYLEFNIEATPFLLLDVVALLVKITQLIILDTT